MVEGIMGQIHKNKKKKSRHVKIEKSPIEMYRAEKHIREKHTVDHPIVEKSKIRKYPMSKNLINSNIKEFAGLIAAVILIVAVVAVGIHLATRKNAYALQLGDQPLGIIKEATVADELFRTAITQIEQEVGTKIQVKQELSGNPVHASKKKLVTKEYMITQIRQNITYVVEAYVLLVDGVEKAILPSMAEANAVLDEVQRQYIPEGTVVEEKNFVEKVDIKPKFVEQSVMISQKDAIKILTVGTEQQKQYKVQAGDSLWSISSNADMTLDELLKANPDITEKSILKIGQEISLIVPKPLLSVQTKEKITYKETIEKPIEYRKDEKQYKDYKKVIQQGKAGVKEITAYLLRTNGYEEGAQILSEKILEETVTEIIVVGTKALPAKRATGNFRRPTGGLLTSRFGKRWGAMHYGIDLASPVGTPIFAADGGRVAFTGWQGGFGKLVIIDHGNGFSTYYGHASKFYAKVGQKVAKGEKIAAVGNTGYSTGPHVHFEIRKNGTPVNPLQYLK
jgi:murein DD-endopeptidase MepM/ murein hydrolase activator NlpD